MHGGVLPGDVDHESARWLAGPVRHVHGRGQRGRRTQPLGGWDAGGTTANGVQHRVGHLVGPEILERIEVGISLSRRERTSGPRGIDAVSDLAPLVPGHWGALPNME